MKKNENKSNLSVVRQQLIDKVLANLEKGVAIWEKGWSTNIPVSVETGKRYTGINNLILSMAAAENGYKDNRWATYSQILKNGWTFKKDKNDQIIAKGEGVGIEFFELKDKETGEKFNPEIIQNLSTEEKAKYMLTNVYPVKKYYHVFNAELIDGVKQKKDVQKTKKVVSRRVDNFLTHWSNSEAKIIYEGDDAYYNNKLDIIHVPQKVKFKDDIEFYLTALHEVAHSTGHETRMNRNLSNSFGSEEYAFEELRAEIGSMFIAQNFELKSSDANIKNNSAYISAWKKKIKNDPQAFFTAVADAERISQYITTKEKDFKEM